MNRYWNKEIETMELADMKALQSERLVKQVKHVYENVPYYKNLMDEKGVKPEDIKGVEDLHKLPFITKDDLREAYPYGMLAKPLSECVRIQSTSGTTGKRVVAFYTQNDIDLWEDCCARAIVAVGGTNEDVCQVCYGYGLFTGGPGLNGGSHKVGCLTLPMSSGNTERQIQFMTDLSATILCCTPSYAAYIAESLKEMGYTPDKIPLKAGIFGAEPWTVEMKRELEKLLKQELAIEDQTSVIIVRRPCALLKCVPKDKHFMIDSDKCKSCKNCMKIGCPALSMQDNKAKIDSTLCIACGLCEQMCHFDAIKKA